MSSGGLMNSNQRILEVFLELYQGKKVTLHELTQNYAVSKRTIQRDLAYITEAIDTTQCPIKLKFQSNGYYSMESSDHLSPEEVLTISKVLLESRALQENEIKKVLNHLLAELSNDSQAHIQQSLANELLYYSPLLIKKTSYN